MQQNYFVKQLLLQQMLSILNPNQDLPEAQIS